ncbi:oxidized purine nucleoside triphosphate hydrolase [Tribolium castaneum]|uniref:Oxidized purine nucleoside triphosphate hydrolase n=1 Tax=Tribolium castaneum TaxID=7070 RepID=D6WUN4_TRICA|nr:PREDICTED: 7,8-dihydro-8-oxoguanine triphosphatase [Tribolium castaneum]EFA09048.1 7,8-dihydro-8-oxoguanine triphosphatase-like Protein [Tribolium castaneum]|eukprot:XP_972089.1 PREDICTED: 7,8-dihydro-8-oxoguanine triphosphatase [Tribolium castaneum]
MKSPVKRDCERDNTMSVNKIFTLVFLKKNSEVLLGYKTRGLGRGLWNGFGGKVEKNETIANCAKRELEEECSLVAKDLKHIGVVRYDLPYENSADIVHIFTCSQYDGCEKASEEMDPIQWYDFSAIPYAKMWPDSPQWYPLMLKEKFFAARVTYSDPDTITDTKIEEFEDLASALKVAN